MWLLYGVLIYVVGNIIGYVISYIKGKIQDSAIRDNEELKEKRMNCFMEQAIPELYKYFTTEQREYCSQASSMEEFCRRYREVVKQNPDIIRAYFDEMKAKVGAKDK